MNRIQSIRRAVSRPPIVFILLTLLVIGLIWGLWALTHQLTPEEKTAVQFVQHSMVHFDSEKLQPLLSDEDADDYSLYDGSVRPGSKVWVGTRPIGQGEVKAVVFFESPNLFGNRVELQLRPDNGKCRVIDADAKGDDKNFETFQQTPYYKGLGIEEWKKAELSD